MEIVIKPEYRANLELLIKKLESIRDENFDTLEPVVIQRQGIECGCIEAWAKTVLFLFRRGNVTEYYLQDLLGLNQEEAEHIFYLKFSDTRYSTTRQEAIEYLKSLRGNIEKGEGNHEPNSV